MRDDLQPPVPRGARELAQRDGVAYVVVQAPTSILPHWLGEGPGLSRDASAHAYTMALKGFDLAEAIGAREGAPRQEHFTVATGDTRIKVMTDQRGFRVSVVYRFGGLSKSMVRTLKRLLRSWPARPPGEGLH